MIESGLHWIVFILFYAHFVQWSVLRRTNKLHLRPPPPFPSFQALNLPFSYTLTQTSFVSHTCIYKPSFPHTFTIDNTIDNTFTCA